MHGNLCRSGPYLHWGRHCVIDTGHGNFGRDLINIIKSEG